MVLLPHTLQLGRSKLVTRERYLVLLAEYWVFGKTASSGISNYITKLCLNLFNILGSKFKEIPIFHRIYIKKDEKRVTLVERQLVTLVDLINSPDIINFYILYFPRFVRYCGIIERVSVSFVNKTINVYF